MSNSWGSRLLAALVIAVIGWMVTAHAQVGPDVKARFIKLPYYENNKTKAMLTGKEARPTASGEIVVTEFRMETYRDGDQKKIELVAEAPECVINRSNFVAYSGGPLKVVTGNGQFLISGEGFSCQPKAGRLYLSNKVHTILRRDLVRGAEKGKEKKP